MKALHLIFCSWVLGLAPTVWAEGLASSFLSEFKLGSALQAPVYRGEGNDETALVIQNFNAITAGVYPFFQSYRDTSLFDV